MTNDPNDAVDFIFKTAPEYAKAKAERVQLQEFRNCLLYTSPSPRDYAASRMPSSA